jgi:hypothetical protein
MSWKTRVASPAMDRQEKGQEHSGPRSEVGGRRSEVRDQSTEERSTEESKERVDER